MKVYTAIAGNYDTLQEQPESVRLPGVEFCAFLDQPISSLTWTVKAGAVSYSSSRLNAKFHKILSHKAFSKGEITMWVDGSITLRATTSVPSLVERLLQNTDIAVFQHPRRYCLYQEAIHCIHHRLDVSNVIREQVYRYTQEGYPANHGLAECTVILRRDTRQVREFNELWWDEIQRGSVRDQISFPYVVWRTGIKVSYFPGYLGDREFFLRQPHARSRRLRPIRISGKDSSNYIAE